MAIDLVSIQVETKTMQDEWTIKAIKMKPREPGHNCPPTMVQPLDKHFEIAIALQLLDSIQAGRLNKQQTVKMQMERMNWQKALAGKGRPRQCTAGSRR